MPWNHMAESLGCEDEILRREFQDISIAVNRSKTIFQVTNRLMCSSYRSDLSPFFPFIQTQRFFVSFRLQKEKEKWKQHIHNFPAPQSKWWKCSYTALDALMEIWMEMMKVGRHGCEHERNFQGYEIFNGKQVVCSTRKLTDFEDI